MLRSDLLWTLDVFWLLQIASCCLAVVNTCRIVSGVRALRAMTRAARSGSAPAVSTARSAAWAPLAEVHAKVDQRCTELATIVADTSRLFRLSAAILVSIAAAHAGIDVGMLTEEPHCRIGWAAYESLQLLWSRLSIALFTCAVLSWWFVILDSAVARRRAPRL